ncbi:(deoxy)nucleoside triphosphate pyrophosphohydrolase [Ruania halotolerans]|uniref:(deoxy)nucleoside triphosphate pyrophosphohydrolase n=1 Tax=Ruania halotolerans TaxID=2897773 RepID=UPI001E5E9E27|nr:NUDIX domain-containing protein [Ruania halotolerans]UFU06236.1 NUDIX domain-containing protein [Ruania halotolerans]
MPDQPRLVVAAAIVDDLDSPTQLLAARRSAPKSLAGQWEFAGGKVEENERDVDALHRELAEELGVQVQLGRRVPGPTGTDGDRDGSDWPILHGHAMRIWFAVITGGTPEPLADHDALRWLPLTDPYGVSWLEPDLPIVTAVHTLATRGPVR